MGDKDEDWILLDDDTPHNKTLTGANITQSSSNMATVDWVPPPILRPDDDDDESDPLHSNILLQSYNVSEREAIIEIIPHKVDSSSYKPTTHKQRTSSSSSSSVASLRTMKTRLESKQRLKQGLLEHPLHHFPTVFIRHFCYCIWNTQCLTIRIGFILVGFGLVLQVLGFLCTMTSFSTFTSLASLVLRCILLGLVLYLTLGVQIHSWVQSFTLCQSSARWYTVLDTLLHHVESSHVITISRRFFLLMILSSTVLQMRAVTFLAWTLTQHVGGFVPLILSTLHVGILILRHFRVYSSSHPQGRLPQVSTFMENTLLPSNENTLYTPFLYFSSIGIQVDRKITSTSLDWRTDAWILLYLSAIFAVWSSPTSSRSTKYTLGGPFLISMGCFLLTYPTQEDEHEFDSFTRILRYSLRLTVHDVMISVGENVAQDEMLLIALLRWIVDYWSNENRCNTNTSSLTMVRDPAVHSTGTVQEDHSPVVSSNLEPNSNHGTILWNDLSYMLSLTLHNLQNDIPNQQNQYPQQTESAASSILENASLSNLQNMLDALNVDDHAKPAVLAYKKAVEDFPPKTNTAIVLSVVRRCPAILSIFYLLSIASRHVPILAIALLPIMCVEVARIQVWIQSCWLYSYSSTVTMDTTPLSQHQNTICYSIPVNMDSMYILFSGDQDVSLNYVPPLLQVWKNILSSVDALESGLVAARYVHTAHVASKLAINVMSLAELAWTVKNKGWLYGVSTVASEIIRDHALDRKTSTASGTIGKKGTQYSRAVVDLIKNGQMLSRNISHFRDEKKISGQLSADDSSSNHLFQSDGGFDNNMNLILNEKEIETVSGDENDVYFHDIAPETN